MNLLEDLPGPQQRALGAIRELAAEKNCRPYLVGGPVRDRMLGRSSIDLDLTMEDGGSTLARALARRLNGRVRSFPQFLTYKVIADGYPEIDIATARKERYRKPGALPAVTAGRLKDDLLRRDFSINAMAIDLVKGTVHDPSGGANDIRDRQIRVLHDRSFIDDPTRIFRAVRLAVRLGFELEPHTASLMAAAIAESALLTVSRERIWRELFLAMDEPGAPAVLARLNAAGALQILFGTREDEDLESRLGAAHAQLEEQPALDRHIVYTGVLLRGDASPVDFEGSGFSQKRARAVIALANDLPRVEESLAATPDEIERFRIYRTLSPEMLALIRSEVPDERASIQRFHDYEKFVLPIRGNDLDVPPGPHVAAALETTREAVFRGDVPADQSRAFARETARRLFQLGRGVSESPDVPDTSKSAAPGSNDDSLSRDGARG